MRMTLWLVSFFAIAAIGTSLARAYALHRNLLDHPGERRSHRSATPRGGGVAIVAAVLVASLVLVLHDPRMASRVVGFAAGFGLVAGIGWWDDHRPLPAAVRLGVHAMASAILAVGFWVAHGEAWLALAAFVAALAMTNIWNFMDGINGLAASQAALVAAGYAAVMSGSAWGWLGWALVAACLGFLPFNFPRARIFLGDVGSGAVGYVIAALAIAALAAKEMAWPLVLVLPSAFIIDAGLTLARRLLRGEQWWVAHAQHAYQGWARRVGSHVSVTLGYAAWTGTGLALMTVLAPEGGFFLTFASVLAWYMSGTFLWWWLQRWSAGTEQGEQMEWRKE